MLICDLSILHKYGKETLNKQLQPLGFSWQEMVVMMALEMNPDTDQALLSKLLQTDKGNVTRLISNMEEKDLLYRIVCHIDSRYKIIHLTDKGVSLLPLLHKAMRSWEASCFNGLNKRQVQQFEELSAHIINNILNNKESPRNRKEKSNENKNKSLA